MIVCPNCSHQNPEGAVQCEACYTPLPAIAACPSCGASVQSDASFCGQCGFDLRSTASVPATAPPDTGADEAAAGASDLPSLVSPDPLVTPDPLVAGEESSGEVTSGAPTSPPDEPKTASDPSAEVETSAASGAPTATEADAPPTQLQGNTAKLLHVQTDTEIELPLQATLVRLGKPNDRVPPDIDVSGFPNSEIVSRVHANLRIEGDIYYVEDVGSSNGTYVNNLPIAPGNRHRLRSGDRIALGKGDKVTFIFQSA